MIVLEFYGTIGPACADELTLRRMAEAGMTGLRFNLSHGSLAEHGDWLALARAAGIRQILIWTLRNHEYSPLGKFDVNKFFRQLAVGTGVGVRYDMGMFVIRVDWGIGLHVPYDTGKSGFYNIRRFKDAQSLHFAVGYPF